MKHYKHATHELRRDTFVVPHEAGKCVTVPSSPPPTHNMPPQAHCHILQLCRIVRPLDTSCSSSSPSSSSSVVTHSNDLFLSASVLANFAPRNSDYSSRSWSCTCDKQISIEVFGWVDTARVSPCQRVDVSEFCTWMSMTANAVTWLSRRVLTHVGTVLAV